MLKNIAIILITLCSTPLLAHGLHTAIEQNDSVVNVGVTYNNGQPFAYEQYEVFGPGDTVPFMNGRSDARGHILFAPDRDGQWKVRFFSEDGHGGEVKVPFTTISEGAAPTDSNSSDRLLRITSGLGYLLGIFGIALFALRFRREQTNKQP